MKIETKEKFDELVKSIKDKNGDINPYAWCLGKEKSLLASRDEFLMDIPTVNFKENNDIFTIIADEMAKDKEKLSANEMVFNGNDTSGLFPVVGGSFNITIINNILNKCHLFYNEENNTYENETLQYIFEIKEGFIKSLEAEFYNLNAPRKILENMKPKHKEAIAEMNDEFVFLNDAQKTEITDSLRSDCTKSRKLKIDYILDKIRISKKVVYGVKKFTDYVEECTDMSSVYFMIHIYKLMVILEDKPVESMDAVFVKISLLVSKKVEPENINLVGIFDKLPELAWTKKGKVVTLDFVKQNIIGISADTSGDFDDIVRISKLPPFIMCNGTEGGNVVTGESVLAILKKFNE